MDRVYGLDRLQLDDDLFFDDEVGAECILNGEALVDDAERLLPSDPEATFLQLVREDGS